MQSLSRLLGPSLKCNVLAIASVDQSLVIVCDLCINSEQTSIDGRSQVIAFASASSDDSSTIWFRLLFGSTVQPGRAEKIAVC